MSQPDKHNPKGWHVALDEEAKAALKVADHNRYLKRMAESPDAD